MCMVFLKLIRNKANISLALMIPLSKYWDIDSYRIAAQVCCVTVVCRLVVSFACLCGNQGDFGDYV